jgi:molybdopterin-guanine dinucleotide biosynthesis protein A
VPVAVVLAGGGPEPALAPGLPNKAFLEIGGRPLVRRVVDALRGCAAVERVLVVGPAEPLAASIGADAEVIPEQASLMDNLAAAVARAGGRGQVLAVASDLPLITSDSIASFLARCNDGADFYYVIVPQESIERSFPTARKTYVKVTDGTFCGGSVLCFNSDVLDRVRPFVEQVINARKKPWLLAQLFGWGTVMKFASGRLSISEMETRAREVTGLVGRAVTVDGPELALDVDADRPENLQAILAGDRGR